MECKSKILRITYTREHIKKFTHIMPYPDAMFLEFRNGFCSNSPKMDAKQKWPPYWYSNQAKEFIFSESSIHCNAISIVQVRFDLFYIMFLQLITFQAPQTHSNRGETATVWKRYLCRPCFTFPIKCSCNMNCNCIVDVNCGMRTEF